MDQVADEALRNGRTTRSDWLRTGLEILVADGVAAIKVLSLARALGVSRSSFYWFFRDRDAFLDHLLRHWAETNTAGIVARAGRPAATITEAVLNLFECWVDPAVYDPRLDFAVREWARRSDTVRTAVEAADEARLAAISAMYRAHGYGRLDAFIRARTLYFMQIGYYALEVREPMDTRLSYVTAYLRSFTGQDPTRTELRRFRAYARRVTG